LHRFDPSDIFPEEREVGRTRAKKKPRNEANSTVSKTRSIDLTSPEPAAAPRAVSPPLPSPTPTATEAEPTPTPEISPEATATPNNVAAAQSSNLPAAPGGSAGANQTGNGQTGFPLYLLIPIFFLSLFGLVAMIISLKKQFRTDN
ncbi:MAG: hypothetical protein J2P31_19410, partial [Blastocatellia bacterium]|nr:hypothetical protein [Blastocatellia bacterium]